MNDNKHNQDSEFAALAQGKLPASSLGRVRRQLERASRRVKQDIRTILQRSGVDKPRVEPAPVRLRDKLRAIPGRESNRLTVSMRWAMAATIAMFLIAGPAVYRHLTYDGRPSPAEIAEARAQLAIAFSYVQQISSRTDYYMKRQIGHSMQDAIIDGIFLGVTKKPDKG